MRPILPYLGWFTFLALSVLTWLLFFYVVASVLSLDCASCGE